MCVSLNKQLLSFFKISPVFYLGLAKERFKRRFLISNVSASKITLYHEQHVACDLRVEQACLRPNSLDSLSENGGRGRRLSLVEVYGLLRCCFVSQNQKFSKFYWVIAS